MSKNKPTQAIQIQTTFGPRTVDAIIRGAWAVHKPWNSRDGWAITHVSSGRAIPHTMLAFATKHEALKAAAEIDREFGDVSHDADTGKRIHKQVYAIIDRAMGNERTAALGREGGR